MAYQALSLILRPLRLADPDGLYYDRCLCTPASAGPHIYLLAITGLTALVFGNQTASQTGGSFVRFSFYDTSPKIPLDTTRYHDER